MQTISYPNTNTYDISTGAGKNTDAKSKSHDCIYNRASPKKRWSVGNNITIKANMYRHFCGSKKREARKYLKDQRYRKSTSLGKTFAYCNLYFSIKVAHWVQEGLENPALYEILKQTSRISFSRQKTPTEEKLLRIISTEQDKDKMGKGKGSESPKKREESTEKIRL